MREVMAGSNSLTHLRSCFSAGVVGAFAVSMSTRWPGSVIRAKATTQKSVREGFGLVVSEALWKGTQVVAGRAGGIPLQMADGVGGLLVDTVEECADGIVALLRDPRRRGAGTRAAASACVTTSWCPGWS